MLARVYRIPKTISIWKSRRLWKIYLLTYNGLFSGILVCQDCGNSNQTPRHWQQQGGFLVRRSLIPISTPSWPGQVIWKISQPPKTHVPRLPRKPGRQTLQMPQDVGTSIKMPLRPRVGNDLIIQQFACNEASLFNSRQCLCHLIRDVSLLIRYAGVGEARRLFYCLWDGI